MREETYDGEKRPWRIVEADALGAEVEASLSKPEVARVHVRRLTNSERRKLKRQAIRNGTEEGNHGTTKTE